MSAQSVVSVAAGEVGYLEKKSNASLNDKTANAGYNNYTKYGAWYDSGSLQGQPWCDIFVSWCAEQAGEAAAVGCYAYCPSHVNAFKSKGQWFARGAKTPQAGDIIFFQTGGVACHVGIVERADATNVYTIEGNTSGGSGLEANGGGVFQKQYKLNSSYILGYGRPNYKKDEEDDDMTENQVRAIVREMLRGADSTASPSLADEWKLAKEMEITDGTRPGGYATREQVAAMIVRSMMDEG